MGDQMCAKCGKNKGGWYNDRNTNMYCSACVGDVKYVELIEKIKLKIKELEGEIEYCKRKVHDYEDVEMFKKILEGFTEEE